MVNMSVSATVSKRGADTSSSTGALPTTSEHVVNTQVRSFSGEPVVIGGLIRQEKNELVSKVPVLGSIPVLGYLFQSKYESVENTELVVYIVPRVDYSEVEETDLGLRLERLYEEFVFPLRYE